MKIVPLIQTFKWGGRGRSAYILMVKFGRGMTTRDFVDLFDRVDKKLCRKFGKTRHEMGIHESASYRLESDNYNWAILWDAPNPRVAKQFLDVWLRGRTMHASNGSGKADNFPITASGRY